MPLGDAFAKFVGRWNLEAVFPPGSPVEGNAAAGAEFELFLGGTFLFERSEVDHPDAPDGYSILPATPRDRVIPSTTSTPEVSSGSTT